MKALCLCWVFCVVFMFNGGLVEAKISKRLEKYLRAVPKQENIWKKLSKQKISQQHRKFANRLRKELAGFKKEQQRFVSTFSEKSRKKGYLQACSRAYQRLKELREKVEKAIRKTSRKPSSRNREQWKKARRRQQLSAQENY